MNQIEAPVLLITFNRPDTARIVFDAIRKAKPKKLYISSDGPRTAKFDADWQGISECRELAKEVDWDCEVHTRFLDYNIGCGPGPSSAVTWALQNEDRIIILEDDCLPSQSFFPFCNKLLEKYKDDIRFMNIAGTRWSEDYPITGCDYFYTRYANIWGWATWKRAWNHFDYWISDYPLFKEKKILNIVECDNAPLIKRWKYQLDSIYNLAQNQNHVWDYQWQYAHYKHNCYSINSVKNLVTNIGVQGIHSSQIEDNYHNRDRYEIDTEMLKAPNFPYPEYGFDAYHGRKFFLKDRGALKVLYDHATSFLNK